MTISIVLIWNIESIGRCYSQVPRSLIYLTLIEELLSNLRSAGITNINVRVLPNTLPER